MTALLDPPASGVLGAEEAVPQPMAPKPTGMDRSFRALLATCAASVLIVLVAILTFLMAHSWWALRTYNIHFFLGTVWAPNVGHPGVVPLVVGSVAVAALAITIALPVSVACSLMINEYSPVALRSWLIGLVDLLATVPSIVFGFWGLEVLSPGSSGTAEWLAHYAGFVPIFRTATANQYGKSIFVCGLIVAVMIIPVVTSVSREVMSQAPREVCEAALGVGGTRWGMVSEVILPFSRSGIVGGAMLGIGRALGETMAVVIILSAGTRPTLALLGPGNSAHGDSTIAYEIGTKFAGALPHVESELTLAGLTLFATTLLITTLARVVVKRSAGVGR